MIERTCQQCGASFHAWPSQLARGNARFCSKSCATTARNLTEANPALRRDISGERNPMYGRGMKGAANPMFGRLGEQCPRWKGGVKVRKDGYVLRYLQAHHSLRAGKPGYVLEHRLVMEATLGRHLTDDEIVHHLNENRSDNRPENLAVMTQAEHVRLHGLKGAA